MKSRLSPKHESGSVLVTTLALGAILGVTLAGYLSWVRTQNVLVAESQAWNAALAHAEAGIEDGLGQINVNFGTDYYSSAETNWGTGTLAGAYGPRTNAVGAGGYTATILRSSPGPTIVSTGYASVPLVGRRILRTVQVTTIADSAFANAITVKSNLTTKGNNLTVDSYDSADPAHSSTNCMYDPATHKAGGNVNSIWGFINVQNANINGKLSTGPGGSYDIGANGWVGDLDWKVKGQIEPGWYANDLNTDLKDVSPPYDSGVDIPSRVDYKTNSVYFLTGGCYYHSGDFVLSQNETLYVQGTNTVYVTGGFNMKSQNACYITLAPGASLKLYIGTVDGAPVTAALTQVNNPGDAGTFQVYGLPSLTTLTWVGNNNYVGTVYAPQATVSLGGGGSTPYDFQGAVVAKSATLNGHFNIHYDENLGRIGPFAGYKVSSWREL